MIVLYLFFHLFCISSSMDDGVFIGCYKDRPFSPFYKVPQYYTFEQCIKECKFKYYKYALAKDQSFCSCSNFLGEKISQNLKCDEHCNNKGYCENKENLTDVYSTGNLVPGPPRNFRVSNITSNSVRLTWDEPESYTEITSYKIKAIILHSFSSFSPTSPEWTYSNNTFKTELLLQSATKYNITINAVSPSGDGILSSQIVETDLGDPDNLPDPPTIIKRIKTQMEVRFMPVTNNNGPVTSYLVVVVNTDSGQIFQEYYLKSFKEAQSEGLTYYIAAELSPKDIEKNFIVGDGRLYGRYQNVPLSSETNYDILLGAVSEYKGSRKIVYSEPKTVKILMKPIEVESDSPVVIIGLSTAIGLLSFMFIAGIIAFIILKSKVTHRRQRLSDNQELTLQGPMIEVENNGYIPEEEPSKNKHYKNLKQRLKAINFNQLKIEPTHLIGIGRFGRVNSGVYDNESVAVYSISDKKLGPEDRKNMLRELDALIKTDIHENIIKLIGTCETPQQVLVVLEHVPINLKDFLLGSRDFLPGRFSNLSESQIFDFLLQIAQGMVHLEKNKIIHKQLCARNIVVTGSLVKISGYGLAQFYKNNKFPDYTRWTSLEVLKGQNPSIKSDVWSYGCLLWETCVLGGTPYGSFPNNEIPERVLKGLRLPQMKYFSDDLYQIMILCWQIDMDERPNFENLIKSLSQLKESTLIPHLSFNIYSSFQYEQFYPDMEIAVRPMM